MSRCDANFMNAALLLAAATIPGCGHSADTALDRGESGTVSPDDTGARGEGDASVSEGSAADAADARPHVATVPQFHRVTATACTQLRPAGTPGFVSDAGVVECSGAAMFLDGGCLNDQDCSSGSNGRCDCALFGGYYTRGSNQCTYDTCASDSDCSGGVCLCRQDTFSRALPGQVVHDPPNYCVTSDCRVDSDCGSGGYCSAGPAFGCGWQYLEYHCHTPTDDCTNDSDCLPQGNAYCAFDKSVGHWVCSTGMCVDG